MCTLPRDPNAPFYADPQYIVDDDLKDELESYGHGGSNGKYADKLRSNNLHSSESVDSKEQNGWSVAGNNKCSCGSGKKYKKCCKKLAKHRQLVVRDGRGGNGNRNGFHHQNGRNGFGLVSNGNMAAMERVEVIEKQLEHMYTGPVLAC